MLVVYKIFALCSLFSLVALGFSIVLLVVYTATYA